MSPNEKTNQKPEGKRTNKKYGVVLCPSCGYLQGRELSGSVFKYQGAFQSVNCYRCKKKIPLMQNVLFESDSTTIASEWIMAYKKKIIKNL